MQAAVHNPTTALMQAVQQLESLAAGVEDPPIAIVIRETFAFLEGGKSTHP